MRRRILAALAALLLLVVGTAVLVAYVGGADSRALAGVQTVEVLVADELIPEGTTADELDGMVRTETVPAKSAVEGRVTTLTSLAGRVATVDLLPGEQLLAGRFARPDDLQPPGTVAVPDGLQEISVLLEPQRVVGARLSAGDTVGVYLSQGEPVGQTHAVLHQVLVTQVQGAPAAPAPTTGTAVDPAASSAPASSLMVTLAVNSHDAESVIFGVEHGTLWLSLEPDGAQTGGTRVVQPDNIYVGAHR
jgi:pilus assembly protein CpaB